MKKQNHRTLISVSTKCGLKLMHAMVNSSKDTTRENANTESRYVEMEMVQEESMCQHQIPFGMTPDYLFSPASRKPDA